MRRGGGQAGVVDGETETKMKTQRKIGVTQRGWFRNEKGNKQ